MITYATYYDHIVRARYSPSLIVENWNLCDRRVIFVANHEEMVCVKDIDAEIVIIGKGIEVPSDIPKAQNACVSWCFDHGADFVVHIMGDIYLTAEGDKFITSNLNKKILPGNIPSMGVMLYSNMWNHQTTCTVSSRDNRMLYDDRGDGEACNVDWYEHAWCTDGGYFLDIGYLGLPQYYGKMVNHSYIWPDNYKTNWLRAYHTDRDSAVRMSYNAMRKYKQCALEPIDYSEYEYVIERLGLQEDYEYCMNILSQV